MTGLSLEDLTVAYRDGERERVVVDGVSLTLEAGGILGLVGESGCGKSTTALAMLGFVPTSARIVNGSSWLGSLDLIAASSQERRASWGQKIAYISQNASLSLNPALRVRKSVSEPLELHLGLKAGALEERVDELLELVSLPSGVLDAYPHQLSGGQQQRVAIAIAISCGPDVLVFDEPTTGLDVTTQAHITRLIRRLVAEQGIGALFVSHDIALLDLLADEVAVMYAGEIVERGPAHAVFQGPQHPYSAALVAATPKVDGPRRVVDLAGLPPAEVVIDRCSFFERCRYGVGACLEGRIPFEEVTEGREVRCIRAGVLLGSLGSSAVIEEQPSKDVGSDALVAGNALSFAYRRRREAVAALTDVSFTLSFGERLGVVGESGSGKSTLLKLIAGLRIPSRGDVTYQGERLPSVSRRRRKLLQEIQIVFQNPDSSLNPRQTIASIIERPLTLFRKDLSAVQRRSAAEELVDRVRLDRALLDRYPDEISGGQRQRVALARAFAAEPRVLLCDEVVSALDVSVQSSILSLIDELVRSDGVAVIFVTHDLAVARAVTDRLMVMKAGRVCETGPTDQVLGAPSHPYTRELLDALPPALRSS